MISFRRILSCVFLLLTASCTQAATPTPTQLLAEATLAPAQAATSTLAPTNEPTTVPTNTPTSEPTETPTEQPTLAPTETVEPTPTIKPEVTVAPTSTPEPLSFQSREALDAAMRSPFTGELLENEAIADRRPILCKVSNSPGKYVRPQSGLNSADLVFEHLSEGVTRFSALFHSQTPERVGPVRSARLIDTALIQMYDAAFCFSGASIGVTERLETASFRGRLIRSYYEGFFRDDTLDVPHEHTFFANPSMFWELELEPRGLNRAPKSATQTSFTSEPPDNGTPTRSVAVQNRGWELAEWDWDTDRMRFVRTMEGELLTDRNDDEPVTTANIVILYVPHDTDPSVCDWQLEQIDEPNADCLAGTVWMDFDGKGKAYVLRDGQRYAATWQSDGESQMLTFVDENGNALPLQFGRTWFHILPFSYLEQERVSFGR